MSLRILAIYRHYWPDTTPYAAILREILERLYQDGHDVTVLAAQPSYNDVRHAVRPRRERIGGIDVHRVWLLTEQKQWLCRRIMNSLLFAGQAIVFALRAGRFDLIIGSTTPAVIMGSTLWLLKLLTGAEYIYHGQDLHPEAGVMAGKIRSRFAPAALRVIERQTCRAAWCNVVLSDDMRTTIEERSIPRERIRVINNFASESGGAPPRTPWQIERANSGSFRLLFAGNLGAFQALDILIDAAHLLCQSADIHFHFVGAGESSIRLQQRAAALLGETVFFHGRQPREVAAAAMFQSDLGIISLARGIYRVAYPSKLMAYLATGLPVLAIVEPESELARMIRNQRIGYIPSSATPEAVADAIRLACRQVRSGQGPTRAHTRQVSDRLFDRTRTLDQWTRLVASFEEFRANSLSARRSTRVSLAS